MKGNRLPKPETRRLGVRSMLIDALTDVARDDALAEAVIRADKLARRIVEEGDD
jgi:hypothetical protein